MPSIIYIIYLIALYSIINYTQEAKRAKRVKEYIIAIIIIKDKDQLAEDLKKDSCLELKTYKVNSLIRITGYQYSILGQSLDNNLQDYKGINIILYNNYQQEELLQKSELSS